MSLCLLFHRYVLNRESRQRCAVVHDSSMHVQYIVVMCCDVSLKSSLWSRRRPQHVYFSIQQFDVTWLCMHESQRKWTQLRTRWNPRLKVMLKNAQIPLDSKDNPMSYVWYQLIKTLIRSIKFEISDSSFSTTIRFLDFIKRNYEKMRFWDSPIHQRFKEMYDICHLMED